LQRAKDQASLWLNHKTPPPYPVKPYKKVSIKYQEIFLSNGDRYEGMTSNGVPQGVGKRISKDGSYYIGDFVNGKENGQGTWFNKQGMIVTQGIWQEGNPVFP